MKYLLIFWLMVGLIVCGLSPLLDQQLAILPYDLVTHAFYGETHLWCKIIYYGVNVATVLLIVIPLVIFIRSFIYNRKNKNNPVQHSLATRVLLISYLSLAIGPGLLVNSLFKNNWGRARPYQVLRDHHPFSYPWQPHLSRPADNSFPSGHVSIGAFIGVPFIAAKRRKFGIGLCAAGFFIVGLVRFLQGGHYFSDIAMALVIVSIVTILVTKFVDNYFMNRYKKQ